MKVKDLAEQLEVDTDVIKELTGKSDVRSLLSEEEVELVTEQLAEPDAPEQGPEPPTNVVRFWSEVRKHALPITTATENMLVKFTDYLLPVEKDSILYNAVIELNDPEIRVIFDKPFDDVGDIKQFRALLEDKVYTGPAREPSMVRGVSFMNALFKGSESEMVAKTWNEHGVAGLIELALKTKSYVMASELKSK
jgi:hypothetical protein